MRLLSISLLVISLSSLISAAPSIHNQINNHDNIRYAKRAQIHPHFANRSYKTVRGVNLGGWFVLESWMTPSFFTPDLVAKGAIDQWTFMTAVNNSATALSLLQKHWSTWITQKDFQAIAAAGLNTVRIPVGHWTFNSSTSEPYLAGAEFTYIAQAVKWAAQYKLDVVIDLHTAPNSQNGFDNSGHQGPIHFASVNATQNAARVYSALQSIVNHFVNHKVYGGAVKAIEILNEPACYAMSQSYMTAIHQAAYLAIRNTIKPTALVKPTVVIHDCFVQPLSNWYSTYANTKTWINGSIAIDTHRYTAFKPTSSQLGNNQTAHINYICNMQNELSSAYKMFPVVVGEWSLGVACSNCTYNTTSESVASQNTKQQNLFYRQFYEAQVTTYEKAGGWIFWNWKTESVATWSYQAGLAQGWIPQNPTTRVFAQTNSCPTTKLIKNVTFATTSMSTITNSTSSSSASITNSTSTSTSINSTPTHSASSNSTASNGTSTNTTSTNSTSTNTTSTTNSSLIAVKPKVRLTLLDAKAATTDNTNPVVVYNNTGTVSGVLQQIIPKVVSIPQKVINSNAFPFIAKTTFGKGIWH